MSLQTPKIANTYPEMVDDIRKMQEQIAKEKARCLSIYEAYRESVGGDVDLKKILRQNINIPINKEQVLKAMNFERFTLYATLGYEGGVKEALRIFEKNKEEITAFLQNTEAYNKVKESSLKRVELQKQHDEYSRQRASLLEEKIIYKSLKQSTKVKDIDSEMKELDSKLKQIEAERDILFVEVERLGQTAQQVALYIEQSTTIPLLAEVMKPYEACFLKLNDLPQGIESEIEIEEGEEEAEEKADEELGDEEMKIENPELYEKLLKAKDVETADEGFAEEEEISLERIQKMYKEKFVTKSTKTEQTSLESDDEVEDWDAELNEEEMEEASTKQESEQLDTTGANQEKDEDFEDWDAQIAKEEKAGEQAKEQTKVKEQKENRQPAILVEFGSSSKDSLSKSSGAHPKSIKGDNLDESPKKTIPEKGPH
ncbi:MAG: hypothetical protein ACHQJ6_08430 [Candidatus Berkiellales bacterium]